MSEQVISNNLTPWQWVDTIPDHWSITQLKYVTFINPSKSEIRTLPEDMEVTFLPMELVGEGTINTENTKQLSDVKEGFTYFAENDVLVAKITPSFENGKGAIAKGLKNGLGFGTTELHVLRPSNKLLPTFLYYLTSSYLFREIGSGFMQGTAGQKRIPNDFLENYPIALPPLAEQQAIITYLDNQIENMDMLIAAKERLLGLLEEKRRALIAEAVTRGVKATADMRDSGVEWLGAIPRHWEVRKLKTICESLQTGPFGSQLHAEDYIEDGIPFINPIHLVDGKIVPDMRVTIESSAATRLAVHKLQKGDLVFARRGEIGRCAVVTQAEVGWICGSGSLRARPWPQIINTRYLFLLISYTFAGQWLSNMSVGTTMSNLNTEIIGELTVPVPPIEEQIALIDYVDQKLTVLNALWVNTQKTIMLLQERRTALIAAAVTGQLTLPT